MIEQTYQTEPLPNNIQQNILVLLCFNTDAALQMRVALDENVFETQTYRTIAKEALEYVKEYKQAPKEHIADLLIDYLNDPGTGKAYTIVLERIYNNQNSVNKDYVLKVFTQWIRRQKFRSAVVESVEVLEQSNDLEKVENIFHTAIRSKIYSFEKGLLFKGNKTQLLRVFEQDVKSYPTGIPVLDNMNYGPAKGELFVFMAPPNRGKTSFMVNAGLTLSHQHRLNVLHISLEMSEVKIVKRYIQNACSVSTRQASVIYPALEKDETGRLRLINFKEMNRPSLTEEATKLLVEKKIDQVIGRWNLLIKRFPTGALSIDGLENYLDNLERFESYIPDVIFLDYADLMKMDNRNDRRIETGLIYQELRRIAVERDIAMVTATQSNRLSEDARVITLKHLAEDYSKAATADNIIAYCQTSLEQRLGLARLFVAKARDEEREQTVLITQSYRIGQFCIDSIMMDDNYWDQLESFNRTPAADNQPEPSRPSRRRRSET